MIEIHTLAWKDDQELQPEDGPTANGSIYSRVFVDGVEIPGVLRVRTVHQNLEFSTASILLHGPIEIFNHTGESWRALDQ